MKPIFVFGSNLAGRHGKGAALHARIYYAAEYGVGEGRTGWAYAIPTKDENLKTLPISEIDRYVLRFVNYANENRNDLFRLTPIGTGLAGYPIWEIADLFSNKKLSDNILFSKEWFERSWWVE